MSPLKKEVKEKEEKNAIKDHHAGGPTCFGLTCHICSGRRSWKSQVKKRERKEEKRKSFPLYQLWTDTAEDAAESQVVVTTYERNAKEI